MSANMIITLMKSLIEKKFYQTKDEAISKLDVYFAINRISESEYAELALLAEFTYAEPEPEPTEDVSKSEVAQATE